MEAKKEYTFIVLSKGGVPLYSFPRVEEKETAFSSLVSAISALGSEILGKKSGMGEVGFGKKLLLLQEKETILFSLVVPEGGEKEEGGRILNNLVEKFIGKFGTNAEALSLNINKLQKFDKTAKNEFKRDFSGSTDVDELLKNAEELLEGTIETTEREETILQQAKKVAENNGMFTTGMLTQQLQIPEEDLKSVVIPQLDLVSSWKENTYYTPSFWNVKKQELTQLLEQKKRIHIQKVEKELNVISQDVPRLAKEVNALKNEKILYHPSLIKRAQKILEKHGKTTLSTLAREIDVKKEGIRELIFPYLDYIDSKQDEAYYAKEYWQNQVQQLKEKVLDRPFPVKSVPQKADIFTNDRKCLINAAGLVNYQGKIYHPDKQLRPLLTKKFAELDLSGIQNVLAKMRKDNEDISNEMIEATKSIITEKMQEQPLETIGSFFEGCWWLDDSSLLSLAKTSSPVIKEKIMSSSFENITHFLEKIHYASMKMASHILTKVVPALKQGEKIHSADVSQLKTFFYQLNLINSEGAEDIATYANSFIKEKSLMDENLVNIGWLLHYLHQIHEETSLQILQSYLPSLKKKFNHLSLASALSFFKTLSEFPNAISEILKSAKEEIVACIKQGENEEKIAMLDFLKANLKPYNKELFSMLKDEIMDYVYFDS